jgi:flagellar hook-basal body complex protein FliE
MSRPPSDSIAGSTQSLADKLKTVYDSASSSSMSSLYEFNGIDLSGSVQYARNTQTADKWVAEVSGSSRQRKSRIVMVDGGAGLGQVPTLRDDPLAPITADEKAAKRLANAPVRGRKYEHDDTCFGCCGLHKSGPPVFHGDKRPDTSMELRKCSACPKVFHHRCAEACLTTATRHPNLFFCPWHRCSKCGASVSSVRGGTMYRCEDCPTTICPGCAEADEVQSTADKGGRLAQVLRQQAKDAEKAAADARAAARKAATGKAKAIKFVLKGNAAGGSSSSAAADSGPSSDRWYKISAATSSIGQLLGKSEMMAGVGYAPSTSIWMRCKCCVARRAASKRGEVLSAVDRARETYLANLASKARERMLAMVKAAHEAQKAADEAARKAAEEAAKQRAILAAARAEAGFENSRLVRMTIRTPEEEAADEERRRAAEAAARENQRIAAEELSARWVATGQPTKLPYNPKDLTWAEDGRTNTQGAYCYCGTLEAPASAGPVPHADKYAMLATATPDQALRAMVRCMTCHSLFHPQCVAVLAAVPLVPADWGYSFVCGACNKNKGHETLQMLRKHHWDDVVRVALNASLECASQELSTDEVRRLEEVDYANVSGEGQPAFNEDAVDPVARKVVLKARVANKSTKNVDKDFASILTVAQVLTRHWSTIAAGYPRPPTMGRLRAKVRGSLNKRTEFFIAAPRAVRAGDNEGMYALRGDFPPLRDMYDNVDQTKYSSTSRGLGQPVDVKVGEASD